MIEQDFEAMSRAQLRSYLNSHRDDSQAWEVFFAKLNENRDLDQSSWYPAPLDEEKQKKLKMLKLKMRLAAIAQTVTSNFDSGSKLGEKRSPFYSSTNLIE